MKRTLAFCKIDYYSSYYCCYIYNCSYHHWACHNGNLNADFKVSEQMIQNIIYFILAHTIIHHFRIFYVKWFSPMFHFYNDENHFNQKKGKSLYLIEHDRCQTGELH